MVTKEMQWIWRAAPVYMLTPWRWVGFGPRGELSFGYWYESNICVSGALHSLLCRGYFGDMPGNSLYSLYSLYLGPRIVLFFAFLVFGCFAFFVFFVPILCYAGNMPGICRGPFFVKTKNVNISFIFSSLLHSL